MIYKYRDRVFTGIDGHMFARNGITEENAPFYVEDLSGQAITLTIRKIDAYTYDVIAPTIVVEKSFNSVNWEPMELVDGGLKATIPANGRLYLRCSTTAWHDDSGEHRISLAGDCEVGGNIMSLLYGKKYTGKETSFPTTTGWEFGHLFATSPIVDASNLKLPALSLNTMSYYGMFEGCRRLITPPVLPATSLALGCYAYMFQTCFALTAAPELPVTTLAQSCYRDMFHSCVALTTAPNLPATTLASGCYKSMFENCVALTTAPILPATRLVDNCYAYMFQTCTKLNYIKCLATNISASNCTSNWVNGVSSTGTFVKNPSMSISTWGAGVNGIPTGWTVQNA